MSPNFPALALIVLAGSSVFAQEGPAKSDGLVDVSKTTDGKIQLQARPLVRQIAPGDPLRVALHFSVVGAKEEWRPDPSVVVDFGKTWEGTKFIVTTPAGKSFPLTAEFERIDDERIRFARGPQPLYQFGSPILVLDRVGIFIPPEGADFVGKWKQKAPDFREPGKYTLELQGELAGLGGKFATGKLNFEVAKETQAIKGAFEKAEIALAAKFPGKNFKQHGWTDVGHIPGFLFEDEKDRRLLFFDGQFEKKDWGYDLVRVTMTRRGEIVEIAHRRVGTCIAAGTPIDTPAGPRPIESLREGDAIWSLDLAAGKRVKTKIQSIRTLHTDSTLLIGESLRITANHPLYVNGEWIPAGEASRGDRLLTAEGKPAVIGEIREKREPIDVFDLTVDEPHNYFAGGFLVHNKSRPWHAAVDDTWHFFWPAKPHEWKVD